MIVVGVGRWCEVHDARGVRHLLEFLVAECGEHGCTAECAADGDAARGGGAYLGRPGHVAEVGVVLLARHILARGSSIGAEEVAVEGVPRLLRAQAGGRG